MLKDCVTNIKSCFADGVHTEVRCQENKTRSVSIISGNLTGNARSEVSGTSARVYKNGVYGFSSMAEVSEEAARVFAAAGSLSFIDDSSFFISL